MKKIISSLMLLSIIASIPPAYSQNNSYIQNMYRKPLNIMQSDIQTQRIPAGTVINLRLETPVNSFTSHSGDQFYATVTSDVKVGNKIVIPTGTLARGFVGSSKKHSYLTKPGMLGLNFDHIVTPLGKQQPIIVKTNNLNADKYDVVKGEGGYLNAVEEHFDKSVDMLTNTTIWGYNKGKSFGKGYPAIMTTPICAFVGGFAGSSYFAYNSFMSLFKKGENVVLNPGQNIQIILKEPVDTVLN